MPGTNCTVQIDNYQAKSANIDAQKYYQNYARNSLLKIQKTVVRSRAFTSIITVSMEQIFRYVPKHGTILATFPDRLETNSFSLSFLLFNVEKCSLF